MLFVDVPSHLFASVLFLPEFDQDCTDLPPSLLGLALPVLRP